MSDRYRIVEIVMDRRRPPWRLRLAGCAGCLVSLFVLGGILGVLLFGWRQLLGG